jgi:acyl-CoA thioesterase FadM
MGVAAQDSLPTEAPDLACATAEMHLTYVRPAFIADEVIARAWVVAIEDSDIYVEAVLLSSDMIELTTAKSRWQQMRAEPA